MLVDKRLDPRKSTTKQNENCLKSTLQTVLTICLVYLILQCRLSAISQY